LGGVNIIPTPTTQSLLWSASYYDSTNKDLFHNSIPQYLLDDPSNQPYITFLDMIGQHFDNIWIYYKDVTNRFNATNNPNTGISLDLVSDALKGLGMQLYTNSNVSDNLYYTLFGINQDGGLLPPTGSEIITNYVTSSIETLPSETIQDEIYKRLYHNLPYLYKTKGTARSIKSLISIYGIPESILTVREFGGNFTGSLDGILDFNSSEYKVNITGSIKEISSSLLSPYTTIQYYSGNNRLNSTNVEVGFSPADVINANISSSQGLFSVDQLIGSPGYMYSSSYAPLVSASNAYFATYTQNNSIWEYIRLLKFYNNSLFKLIKDFVPARANVSTGIIVKSHLYERNKYARHEPNITFNDYSQSIDILEVSADNGEAITGSTEWSGFLVTPLGLASYSSSQNEELYTGQYSGSNIVATEGLAMEQGDYISHITGAINFYNYGALYQNITASVRSQDLVDLDYNSDQLKPVNYNLVTNSLNLLNVDAYAAYTNPNNPFAQVQDYNYNLRRSLLPRYIGSDTISATYNTYTAGDQSYGKTAAIDKIKYQYAYLVDIYTASFYLPNRSNAQIKYLIDNNENVLDLTKANKNIFEVQNVFKSGETTNISLFDYDENNPYTQKLANDPTLAIYEGGYRYLPILHNLNRTGSQQFELANPEPITVSGTSGGTTPDPAYREPSNYVVNWTACDVCGFNGETTVSTTWYASVTCSLGPIPYDITFNINYTIPTDCAANCSTTVYTRAVSMATGNETLDLGSFAGIGPCTTAFCTDGCYESSYPCGFEIVSISGAGGGRGGSGTPGYTYWTTSVTSSQSCIYYRSQSSEIIFSTELAYWYSTASPIVFSSSSDIDWSSSLGPVVTPFSLSPGDKISLYNTQSLGWSELNELTVKGGPRYYTISASVLISSSLPTNYTSSVMAFEIDPETINLLSFSSGSGVPIESITGAAYRACRYIVWKRVPDETNVMLRFNPTDPTIVENGILFPQYIDQPVRENAGNVIKSLKQQNLI